MWGTRAIYAGPRTAAIVWIYYSVGFGRDSRRFRLRLLHLGHRRVGQQQDPGN
jgi:hypothetical protein